ncbi:MAG TPA: carboxypeptidase regulatory-like domain-containing protein [Streptosporangiaceae bacterium]|jgi:N-acetylneuraminic acid mutarotase
MSVMKAYRFRRPVLAILAAAALSLAGLSAPGSALAATASPAALGSTSLGVVPVRQACPAPKPGDASCLALVRTNVRGHVGAFAAGTAPTGYGPADLQSAYSLPSATAGAGQTVAVVDAYDDPDAAADLQIYRKQYGLPACTTASGCFHKVNEKGQQGSYPLADADWAEEESLDVDMVSAICPRCRILLVEATSDSLADLGQAVDTAITLGVKYVSNSYGTPEYSGETASDAYYDHPGTAITVATGDSGYDNGADDAPNWPATSEYVTAVGGTSLARDPSSPRGWSEAAWAGGGSGCSLFEAKPPWQHDSGCGANHMTADVSAVADPNTGVAVYDTFSQPGWGVFGGTSVASPIIASTYALAGPPAAGSYPASYPYADPSALNDITIGSNGTCTPAYWCTAGPGYDGPTGPGAPDGTAAFFAGHRATITGTVSSAAAGKPVTDAQVQADGLSVVTNGSGQYTISVPAGTYTVTVSDLGYTSATARHVRATANHTATKDFRLRPVPTVPVSGTVTDGSGHHWPLLARISVAGTTEATYTDPATGQYSLALPENSVHTLDVDPVYSGYQQVKQAVTTATAGLSQDTAVPVDASTCTAAGYKDAYQGKTQTFNASTAPSGWTVSDTPGTSDGWEFGTPDGSNETGGSGNYAWSDGNAFADTSLYTPVTNLVGDPSPVLQFRWSFLGNKGDGTGGIYVDLSTDGGKKWRTVWQDQQWWYLYGTKRVVLQLPQAARKSQVQIRFRYVNSAEYASAGWQLDNVFFGNRPSAPSVQGGLVTGTVTDANTSQGITCADVITTGPPQEFATTSQIPGDPAAGNGFYWMFSPLTGSQQFRATAPNYVTQTESIDVTANADTSQNFTLSAGQVTATPGSLSATEQMGATTSEKLKLKNTGTTPLSLSLGEQPSTGPSSGGTGNGKSSASSHAWISLPNYPLHVYTPAVVTDPTTGDVYSFGGMHPDGYPVKEAYMYRPGATSWTPLPDIPISSQGIEELSGAYVNGKIYLVAGLDFNTGIDNPVYVYDIATDTWSQGPAMPNGPFFAAGTAVVNGKIYVVAGSNGGGSAVDSVEVYTPSTGTWAFAASYPIKAFGLSCAGMNGLVYCAGGYTSDAFTYNPGTDTWSSLPSMPSVLSFSASSAADGQFLISGGYAGNGNSKLGYAYAPGQGWTRLPQAPTALAGSGGACGFYRIGGGSNLETFPFVLSNKVWQLAGYSDCGSGSGTPVPWLSVSSLTATLQPGQSVTDSVTLDAGNPSVTSVTQPGTYTTQITVQSNTPYQLSVPVTMTVTPLKSWGEITGTVTSVGKPLAGATVQIGTFGGTGQVIYTLTTNADGEYTWWLDHKYSPLQVIVGDTGYAPQAKTTKITAGAPPPSTSPSRKPNRSKRQAGILPGRHPPGACACGPRSSGIRHDR